MHLLDGIVTQPAVGLAVNAIGCAGVGLAVREIRSTPKQPLAWAGTLGAFVLAAQAINVPVLGVGVSAHVIGSGLLTLVLGPALAIAVLSCVVLLQAVLGDGGYTALGINWLNIAVLPTLAMHLVASALGPQRRATAVLGTVVGSVLGALSLSAVLVVGAGAAWRLTLPLLVGVQAVTGLVEGLITSAALVHLRRKAPGLLTPGTPQLATLDDALSETDPKAVSRPTLRWTAVALGVLLALVPFASRSPDALERVVERLQVAP